MSNIKGFDNYFVSEDSSIYSKDRIKNYVWKGLHKSRFFPSKKISPVLGSNGYMFVNLYSVSGAHKMKSVHRIVAEAFLENPENKPCVNHIDGDKTNNSISNLEWCTHSENSIHAVSIGLIKEVKGINNSSFKFPVQASKNGFGYIMFGRSQIEAQGFENTRAYRCLESKSKHRGFEFDRVYLMMGDE